MIKFDNILIPVEFIQEIGQNGQNSQVFLAKETNINRDIVIKQILKSNLNTNYYQEAIYLNQAKHPNVVEINYAGESSCKKYVYLAMPYYKNKSLKEKIFAPNLTVQDILKYSIEFLSGLNCLHIKKLLHLDIKPDNILISDQNNALLSDFGVVTTFPTGKSVQPSNPMFLMLWSPEYINSGTTNIFTDIYQVGVTLYLMCHKVNIDDLLPQHLLSLSGNAGIDELQKLIKSGKLYPKTYPKHIPMEIQKIINRCLHIDMSKRYSSIRGLINDLSQIKPNKNLEWNYQKTNQHEKWWRSDNKECFLDNSGNIKICNNKKNIYSGNEEQKLLDFLNQ